MRVAMSRSHPSPELADWWDTAAGHGVVAVAGGVVCQPNNAPLNYAEPAKTLNPFFIVWGLELGPMPEFEFFWADSLNQATSDCFNIGAVAGLFLNLISAVQRSKASCIRSQLSGVPPTALAMRMAISAVTAFFS
jgi:hypothetical protein